MYAKIFGMRWLIIIFLAIIVLTSAIPWLQKLGIGRLPGDFNFSLFGKNIQIPIASTVLIGLILLVIAKLL